MSLLAKGKYKDLNIGQQADQQAPTTTVHVLMRPYQRKGFPAIFIPFGVVTDERVAQDKTSTGNKYYSTFTGHEGRWVEKVEQAGDRESEVA